MISFASSDLIHKSDYIFSFFEKANKTKQRMHVTIERSKDFIIQIFLTYKVNSQIVNDLESTGLFVKKRATQHNQFLHSKIKAI